MTFYIKIEFYNKFGRIIQHGCIINYQLCMSSAFTKVFIDGVLSLVFISLMHPVISIMFCHLSTVLSLVFISLLMHPVISVMFCYLNTVLSLVFIFLVHLLICYFLSLIKLISSFIMLCPFHSNSLFSRHD